MTRTASCIGAAALAAALAALAPAGAAAMPAANAGPSVRVDSTLVSAGDTYVLAGSDWSVDDGCEPRVRISRTLGHGVRVGSAAVRADGSFTFSRRIPRDTARGARLVLDATQYCDGLGTTRSATVRVGRPEHGCPGSIGVDGEAYVLRVTAGLRCARGARAIGPFLDTDLEPWGFLCAWTDPKVGHDAVCMRASNPASRVTARHIREV